MTTEHTARQRVLAACLLSAIGISCWNLLPVLLGAAADAFALDDRQTGLLGSSLLCGWLLATLPAFLFLHNINRRATLISGACLAASGFAASQFTTTVAMLYTSWITAGFGTAIVYCISIQLIAELGDIERAFGMKVMSEVFSGAVLLYVFPVFIIATWNYPGMGYGMAMLYLAAIILLPWINSRPPAARPKAVNRSLRGVPLAAWVALFALLLFLCGITGLWTFLERIGVDVGVGHEQMGMVLAILKLVGGAAGITAAIVGAKYGLRWPHIVTCVSIVTATVFLHSSENVLLFAIGAWTWEFGFTLGFAYQCAALVRLDPSARLLLLIPSCIGLSGVIGPAVAGYIKSADSYLNLYYFVAGSVSLAAVIFFFLLTDKDFTSTRGARLAG